MIAKLEHFSCHTSATESHQGRIKYSNKESTGVDVVYNIYLSSVEVYNEELLLDFEEYHRLDYKENMFSGNKKQEERNGFYCIIQPKLRDKYSWHISETKHNNKF